MVETISQITIALAVIAATLLWMRSDPERKKGDRHDQG